MGKFSGGAGWNEFAFRFRKAMGTADEEVRENLDENIKGARIRTGSTPWLRGPAREESPSGSPRDLDVGCDQGGLLGGERGAMEERVGSLELVGHEVRSSDPLKFLMATMQVVPLPTAVQDWEVKVKNLTAEHDIGLGENIKVA